MLVGVATGRSGDRIPVGARFSVPVQAGPGVHPAPQYNGYWVIPGVKRLRRGVDHPPSSRAEVRVRVELHHYYSGSSWSVLGSTLPLPLPLPYIRTHF